MLPPECGSIASSDAIAIFCPDGIHTGSSPERYTTIFKLDSMTNKITFNGVDYPINTEMRDAISDGIPVVVPAEITIYENQGTLGVPCEFDVDKVMFWMNDTWYIGETQGSIVKCSLVLTHPSYLEDGDIIFKTDDNREDWMDLSEIGRYGFWDEGHDGMYVTSDDEDELVSVNDVYYEHYYKLVKGR